ncbi:MAG: DUF624 domain-containing protein [Eubacterium sp.]|jgi:uncharacterized membrane protein YesL|nr:DUF624 domain-containing protein [Eubacterium sp.]HBE10506.1 hypothetical protein [Lachnospiraceae bacterium]
MKMFSIDGPIYKFMSALTNMFLLNICWLVGTIIGLGTTIGVSTVAAFDIGLKLAENKEGYVVKQFIQAYKKNLKQGFPLGLIALVASYTVYLDFEIFNKVPNATIFLLMWGFLSGAIFFSCLVYAFPLSARYTNSLRNTIKNSFRISIRYFGRTVLLALVIAILVLSFMWNWTLILIGILIGPAAIILTVSMFAMPIFRRIERQNTEDGLETYSDRDEEQ